MKALDRIARHLDAIRELAGREPSANLRKTAADLLDTLLTGVSAPEPPDHLKAAPGAVIVDYCLNWNHQFWYHLGELLRIHESRRERAHAQGGDSWAHEPPPDPATETENHLKELAKLVRLLDDPPPLRCADAGRVLFADPLLDEPDAWDIPAGLEVERDPAMGLRWKGHKPGGHWFWLKQELPAEPVSFRFESHALPEDGGLIVGFCAQPREPGITFKITSSPRMSDYYKNFQAYHFSVTRGTSGYSNLRRCGTGLIMLASFPDPCPAPNRWHTIEIVKNGPQIDLRADGRLAACYLDYGHVQTPLDGGFFGIRHFGGLNAWHRNLRLAGW